MLLPCLHAAQTVIAPPGVRIADEAVRDVDLLQPAGGRCPLRRRHHVGVVAAYERPMCGLQFRGRGLRPDTECGVGVDELIYERSPVELSSTWWTAFTSAEAKSAAWEKGASWSADSS